MCNTFDIQIVRLLLGHTKEPSADTGYTAWVNLEPIALRGRSQSQRTTHRLHVGNVLQRQKAGEWLPGA